MAQESEIRYLTPLTVDNNKKKYCRFKKSGIKYIDYKDPISLLRGAGVDMTSKKPVTEALKLFGELIDEMEDLMQ